MEEFRTVRKIITGERAIDGAGVKLVRVVGYNEANDVPHFYKCIANKLALVPLRLVETRRGNKIFLQPKNFI